MCDFAINRTMLPAAYTNSVQLLCIHILFHYYMQFYCSVLQTIDCIVT
jgi:hypothetical protein